MTSNKDLKGHLLALLTVLIWGTTFVCTKLLLAENFKPIEILFYRFILGFLVLFIMNPKRLKHSDFKLEALFALAGLFSVTLYYLFENIALTYTTASNVGVITSTVPFFTSIFAILFLKTEKLTKNFIIGFVISMIGVIFISFNGTTQVSINPKGDFLALLASIVWSLYSIVLKKISAYNINTILVTRKTFFYGLLFMIPALFMFNASFDFAMLLKPAIIANFLFLGIGACAICFVTWGMAVNILGAVKTSIYIYAIPIITVITSVLVLGEVLTFNLALGTTLTLLGLIISQRITFKSSVVFK